MPGGFCDGRIMCREDFVCLLLWEDFVPGGKCTGRILWLEANVRHPSIPLWVPKCHTRCNFHLRRYFVPFETFLFALRTFFECARCQKRSEIKEYDLIFEFV